MRTHFIPEHFCLAGSPFACLTWFRLCLSRPVTTYDPLRLTYCYVTTTYDVLCLAILLCFRSAFCCSERALCESGAPAGQ
ncbi:uncharacterized protein C8Q71DRAFT_595142 [Rhodofomes roseus]|uniref:Secreted protein n=1 Tax=Rhodofomes roseus TaxID=34475 RepID=A0ABQ8KHE9_9APHY|nr:uncharacterized protein C8Q71DRAFT_595142 [Rhodofomes roseus]KAH9837290.1 hypothetical protein C8Q71DRAFT_595142 [Rhodofomes roseus]